MTDASNPSMSTESGPTPEEKEAEYRRTHSVNGYPLGGREYPDNREGRRALARTWKRGKTRWKRGKTL